MIWKMKNYTRKRRTLKIPVYNTEGPIKLWEWEVLLL